jgi:hypothetical protein
MAGNSRMSPSAQAGMRKKMMASIDTTGMDPQMAATIREDLMRRQKVKMATSPMSGAMDRLMTIFGRKKKKPSSK